MNKITKHSLAAVPLLLALVAMPAYAATLSLTPATITVAKGQTVTVQVLVNSGTAQTVTAEAQLSYPSSILTATGFTFAPGWTQLSEPGYDSMGSGTIIKTAGYADGFTGTQTLGTATFTATQSGTATIAVTSGSQTFASQGGNTLVAPYGSATVTVGGTSVAQTTTTTTTAPNGQTTTVQATTANGTTNTSVTTTGAPTSPTTAAAAAGTNQGAAVATTGAGSSVPTWVWIVGALVVLGLIIWGARSYSKRA